ncbi:MAG: hypothetical protein CVU57_04300 [Deltaproteobacteria bacterium HGW-Deltaproteobacteria-15]|jgi:hypothetical protein|nr:MAG: hypothetical protein CVU57_04300 [Deltaproteobacteria bacterium HGW-Deltaproteobacteria-15]
MKIDWFAEDSLKKNGVRILREGMAAARFNLALDCGKAEKGRISLAAPEDNAGLSPEEFLVKPWRILSQTLTPYRFFDFTREGVLKAAVPLFDGLTVYANHYADVERWKGYTKGSAWDEKNDPPGINALLVIDRTVDANLARGVEIGALKSASVTIWFEFEKSHPDLRYYYDHIGTVVDGEVVRFIVTKIERAAEVSIVWEGEDPFAKALSAQLAAEDHREKEGGEGMKFSQKFLAALGIQADQEMNEEKLEAAVNAKLAAMQTEIDGLKPDAEAGKKHLAGLRERAASLYKALKGDGANESYVKNVILRADLETAQALVDEYESGLESAVPLSCPKCGEKLSRRSSVELGQPEAGGEKKRAADYKL